jgi:hypothetical protein
LYRPAILDGDDLILGGGFKPAEVEIKLLAEDSRCTGHQARWINQMWGTSWVDVRSRSGSGASSGRSGVVKMDVGEKDVLDVTQ